jgi:hypothetical protein
MAGLAAVVAFFAVCALAATAAIAMTDVTAMSVVRTVDIGVSLMNEYDVNAADYTPRVNSAASRFDADQVGIIHHWIRDGELSVPSSRCR